MDDIDEEIIETSDNEELEALHAEEVTYWRRAASDIRARRPVYASSLTRPLLFNGLLDMESPRKRVKFDREAEAASLSEPAIRSLQSGIVPATPQTLFQPSSSPGYLSQSLTPPLPGQRQTSSPLPSSSMAVSVTPYSTDPFVISPLGESESLPVIAQATPQGLVDINDSLFTPEAAQQIPSRFSSLTPPPDQKPTSSPSFQSLAQNSSPLSILSSPTSVPSHNPQDESMANALTNGDEFQRRYTMRTRRPQQLNPYIYDQMLYKRQMRSNPDAIVKFRVRAESPGRKSRALGDEEEGPEDERRNDMYVGGEAETQDWSMDIDDEEEEENSWIDRRRKRDRRHGKKSANKDASPFEPPMNEEQAWLPAALQDLPSSDEDDLNVRDLLREAKKVKERTKRREKEREEKERNEKEQEKRRRPKPFPMRKQKPVSREDGKGDTTRSPSPIQFPLNDEQSATPPAWPAPRHQPSSRSSRFKSQSPVISIQSSRVPSPLPFDDGFAEYGFGGGFGQGDDYMDHGFDSPVRPQLLSHPSQEPRHPTVGSEDEQAKVQSRSRSRESTGNNSNSSSMSSSSNEMTTKDRKRLKALQRMMPAAMAIQLQKNAQRQKALAAKRHRSATADIDDKSEVEEGPLLPGQTRVKIREQRHDIDIKGDTESEDSESRNDLARSDSDAEINRPKYSGKRNTSPQMIYISDGSIEDSSDNEVDDAKIGVWLADRQRPLESRVGASRADHHSRIREESLVDWMLTRTRTVGGQRKPKDRSKKHRKAARDPSDGQPRIDVVTAGAHKGKQALLSFDRPSYANPRKSTSGVQCSGRRVEGMSGSDENLELEPRKHWVEGKDSAKSFSVKKRKQKKSRGPQLYIFPSKGAKITSGRKRENAITIDAEDHGFHEALVPISENKTRHLSAQRQSRPKSAGVHNYHDVWVQNAPVDIEMDYNPNPSTKRHEQPVTSERRDIKFDFGISFLPSGMAFTADTYVGKGWLHELVALVSGGDNVDAPNSYAAHGIELGPATSPSDFSTSVVAVVDGLLNFALGSTNHQTTENNHQWEGIMRTVGQLLVYLPAHSSAEDCTLLRNTLQEQLLRLITLIEDGETFRKDGSPSNPTVFSLYWFAIESIVRFACGIQKSHPDVPFDATDLIKYISLLTRHLQDYGMHKTLEPILAHPDELDTKLLPQRTAELWVCLFHLVSNCNVTTSDGSTTPHQHPFWRIVQLSLQHDGVSPQRSLETSENIWQTIFGLCALSQFSAHGMTTSTCRLPASWDLVAFALKQIRLAANPETDKMLSERSLDKRDEYIAMIASRCFILSSRWHWKLDDAPVMFNQLVDIFRSRKFANLRQEPSDFPSFMLENDMRRLAEYKPSDTAFELFLKLIVQASNKGHPAEEPSAQRAATAKVKKLLALAIPVGSVPFTKSTPPTIHELSMLYNRLSAVAVAIYLDSSPTNIRNRLNHARRYVNFKDADDTTRVACIRGMMHFAIIMRHCSVPLDEALSWLSEMTETLVGEYRELDALANKANEFQLSDITKQRTILSIQVLLGSVRRIIDTPNIDSTRLQKPYPEPGLLDGPWVKRVFASTSLTHIAKTGLEIRRLVQAFLDARRAAMPISQRHPVAVAAGNEESQESQEEFGAFDLDLDDPDLQAALGDDVSSSTANEIKVKDQLVCNVVDAHITPAIYRLVCKHFNDPSNTSSFEEYCQDADKWIDCWVGCASISVQNGKRKWDSFLQFGLMSWERIIDTSWRRRVGLRFMFMFLRLDPDAYTTYTDRFIEVLFESIVADQLRHPLLRHIPCQPRLGTTDYDISVPEFLTLRLPALDTIFINLADHLRNERPSNLGQNQTYIGFVVTMLSTMQDVCEQLAQGSDERTTYSAFCRNVFGKLQRHPELKAQPRLSGSLAWAQRV